MGARFPEYAVSSARLATIQDTIRETECPASGLRDMYVDMEECHHTIDKSILTSVRRLDVNGNCTTMDLGPYGGIPRE